MLTTKFSAVLQPLAFLLCVSDRFGYPPTPPRDAQVRRATSLVHDLSGKQGLFQSQNVIENRHARQTVECFNIFGVFFLYLFLLTMLLN